MKKATPVQDGLVVIVNVFVATFFAVLIGGYVGLIDFSFIIAAFLALNAVVIAFVSLLIAHLLQNAGKHEEEPVLDDGEH